MRNDMRQMQTTMDSVRQEVTALRAIVGTGLAFAPAVAGVANVGQLAGVKRERDEGEAVGGVNAPRKKHRPRGSGKQRKAARDAAAGAGGEGGEAAGGDTSVGDTLPPSAPAPDNNPSGASLATSPAAPALFQPQAPLPLQQLPEPGLVVPLPPAPPSARRASW